MDGQNKHNKADKLWSIVADFELHYPEATAYLASLLHSSTVCNSETKCLLKNNINSIF
jgi:hypothetical protein